MSGSTTVEVLRIKVLCIVKSSKKQLPTVCPLREAEVVEVRRAEGLEIDVVLHDRLDEDLNEEPTELEGIGAGQWFVAEDDNKDVPEGHADVLRYFIHRMDHVADGVDEHVDRKVFELDEGVRSTSLVSRVIWVIVSEKRHITSSRFVSSALQSLAR